MCVYPRVSVRFVTWRASEKNSGCLETGLFSGTTLLHRACGFTILVLLRLLPYTPERLDIIFEDNSGEGINRGRDGAESSAEDSGYEESGHTGIG